MAYMARSRLCRSCSEFHDLAQPWPSACASHFGNVGTDPGFYLIRDGIDPFRSMADGRLYDSKSQYRNDLRARGMIEVGNEQVSQAPTKAPPIRGDIRRAIQQLS